MRVKDSSIPRNDNVKIYACGANFAGKPGIAQLPTTQLPDHPTTRLPDYKTTRL